VQTYDVVIVGSGINSLVCAAILAKKGRRVAVLERNDRLGGCIRTEELFPGYTHDVLSSWYPLFVAGAGYQALADDLHARGLEFAKSEIDTGVLTPDGRSLVLSTDDRANRERVNDVESGDGDRLSAVIGEFFSRDAALTFGLLGGRLRGRSTLRLLAKELRSRRMTGTLEFAGSALESCRSWLEKDFKSDLVRAVIAPWVLHAGLGPDDAFSGIMAKVIIGAVTAAGLPVATGGSQGVIDAFSGVISDNGGELITGAEVESVIVADGKAIGVTTGAGGEYRATRAVVCNVTPQALYGRLLAHEHVPASIAAGAASYRYGRAGMQIHYALDQPPRWSDPGLAATSMIHVTSGLDGVSRAVNEAERGLLPAEGTIVVGQPTVADPTRAPSGGSILWIQLQELPSVIRGDSAGEIDPPPGGGWTPEVAEAYADRIQKRLMAHIPNLESSIVGRKVFSPADLERLNPNLVGGDPYSGACTLDQSLWWRPFATVKDHSTPVDQLFHIGASTHPGPGLGGNSGYMVAAEL